MKSGIIAVIGRSNAGKSTLINVLVGEKVSIVSPKPQTTRNNILGILNGDGYQAVFVDTPGAYKEGSVLSKFMQKSAKEAQKDVDLLLYVVDGHKGINDEDILDIEKSLSGSIPAIIAFTKIDIMERERILEEAVKLSGLTREIDLVPVSARKGRNLKKLRELIVEKLPEGEQLYPEDILSDKSDKFMVSEIMREKLLLLFDKEIPHGVAIVINEFKRKDSGTYEVNLDIVCEKQSHKAIIIGKQGKALKDAASFARKDMEKYLGAKVFLTTYVKVEENWRDRGNLVKEFGYDEKLI